MKKERIDNNCLECAFCVKHYGNIDGRFYLISGYKHCIHPDMNMHESSKRLSNRVACEYWQPEKIQREQRRGDIVKVLCRMAEQIDEIAQILKEENN